MGKPRKETNVRTVGASDIVDALHEIQWGIQREMNMEIIMDDGAQFSVQHHMREGSYLFPQVSIPNQYTKSRNVLRTISLIIGARKTEKLHIEQIRQLLGCV